MIDADTCCCVTEKIGYDSLSPWLIHGQCFEGYDAVTSLAANVSAISECKVVFSGNNNDCGNAVRFSAVDWPAVKAYIQGGGRLWLQAEFKGCLQDPAKLADFLAALGSSMAWGDTLEPNSGGNCNPLTNTCTPGAANIAQGTVLRIAAASKIDGGTSVWVRDNPIVAAEKLGNGFLFLTGDSNITSGCGYNNCVFLQRLATYADGDIL